MNPAGLAQKVGQAAGNVPAAFTKQHHDVYEKLRSVLMGLHAQGVPGMANVLQALNKEHVNQAPNSPAMRMGKAMSPMTTTLQPQQQVSVPSAMGGAMGGQITPDMIQALQAVRGGGAPTFSGGQVPDGSATY